MENKEKRDGIGGLNLIGKGQSRNWTNGRGKSLRGSEKVVLRQCKRIQFWTNDMIPLLTVLPHCFLPEIDRTILPIRIYSRHLSLKYQSLSKLKNFRKKNWVLTHISQFPPFLPPLQIARFRTLTSAPHRVRSEWFVRSKRPYFRFRFRGTMKEPIVLITEIFETTFAITKGVSFSNDWGREIERNKERTSESCRLSLRVLILMLELVHHPTENDRASQHTCKWKSVSSGRVTYSFSVESTSFIEMIEIILILSRSKEIQIPNLRDGDRAWWARTTLLKRKKDTRERERERESREKSSPRNLSKNETQ